MRNKLSLEEIKQLWEKEPNKFVLKAARKDRKNYPPDIQKIIFDEAQKRGLLDSLEEFKPYIVDACPPSSQCQSTSEVTSFYCTKCGIKIILPADMIGKLYGCPSCKFSAIVPPLTVSSCESEEPLTNERSIKKLQPYAGFWRRVFSYLIDIALLDIINEVLIVLVLGFTAVFLPESALWATLISFFVFRFFLFNWLYFAFMESSRYQATIGKQLLGIIVQDLPGYRLSFWRSTARYFVPMILWIPCLIAMGLLSIPLELEYAFISTIIYLLLVASGGLLIAFTSRKQALHDLVTRCVVVRNHPDDGKLHNLSAWRTAMIITGIFAFRAALAIFNNYDFRQDQPQLERFAVALVIAIMSAWPLFLLILIVKRARKKGLIDP